MLQKLLSLVVFDKTSNLEKWISAIGGMVSLLAILFISHATIGPENSAALVASMGASAVLLFSVPHGPLSQPWSVLGGHSVSAFVGVSCAIYINDPIVAAALSVALAIMAMQYLHCLHPPGGATALSEVVGNDAVHQLGYQYMLTPVLINALIILIIAIVFNYPFHWRRYPLMLRPKP